MPFDLVQFSQYLANKLQQQSISLMEEKNNNWLESLIFPLIVVAVMWLIALIELMFGVNWYWLGVLPRTLEGLKGIIFAPLIHSGFSHLISNSIPFLVAGTLIMQYYKSVAFRGFALMYFITGILVWAFARNGIDHATYHIGASGVVYAMVSFIFFSGLVVRNRLTIVLALVMIFLYSGMIQGIVPNQAGISWESHLIGGIVGAVVAFGLRDDIKTAHKNLNWDMNSPPTHEEPKTHFLQQDIFDKTKQERWAEELQSNQNQ